MARLTHLGNQCLTAMAAISAHASLTGKCNVQAMSAGAHIMAKHCGMVRSCPAQPTVAIPVHVEVLDRLIAPTTPVGANTWAECSILAKLSTKMNATPAHANRMDRFHAQAIPIHATANMAQ